jgi:hypothetical protein
VELFYPIMLFLLHAGDAEGARPELTRHPVLFETVEACEAEGKRILERAGGDAPGPVHAYCTAIPGPEEFETLFEAMDARRDDARAHKP